MHKNRLKEKKVEELKLVLSQIVLLNGGIPEETYRSPSSALSRSQQLPPTPEARIALLNSQLSETEDKIDSEARETERVEYMLEKTNRAMHESRTKCQMLQKQCGIILGKYTEIQDLEARSRYGLQHAKSEAQIFGETLRKDSEKRSEKLGILKKDKHDIEETTARIVKTLAEQMVKGQASKNVAETHAHELDAIYDKHITSLTSTRHDEESKENLDKALHTICDLINRSEALALEHKVPRVRLSDLIGFTHQFEMKMSSMESQVQSMSMWKHDLEVSCVKIRTELETMRGNEFQTADLMTKIQSRLEHLGIRHPVSTFNQLKTFTESMDKSVNSDEVLKHDAFLASSFMTLNVVTKRVVVMLEYILNNAGPHPGKLRDLMHALALAQKHGETYVTSGSAELPDIPIWEQDVSTASWFFREAFDEISEWGLDLDDIIKETCNMLLVRIFAIDSRLKSDLRTWHSSHLPIIDTSLHQLFLEQLISLSHAYLRSKLSESFSLMRSLVLTISETTVSIEKEVTSTPLTDPQLLQIIDFKLAQSSGSAGKPATFSEKSVSDIIRKAFEKKYKKLMVQQHAFKLEEESAEFVSRFHTKKKTELPVEPAPDDLPDSAKFIEEDTYATTLRQTAKSAGRPLPLSKSSSQGLLSRIDSPTILEHDSEAFAQVRSLNVRIRAIKETEKSPASQQTTQRLLPDIRTGSRASEGKVRRGVSERQTGRERKGSSRGRWGK